MRLRKMSLWPAAYRNAARIDMQFTHPSRQRVCSAADSMTMRTLHGHVPSQTADVAQRAPFGHYLGDKHDAGAAVLDFRGDAFRHVHQYQRFDITKDRLAEERGRGFESL